MNIIFMGTPEFAVPSLQELLHHGYEVKAVVSQPDRPKGRKRVLSPTPVKEEALKYGIPVLQPEKLRTTEAVESILALEPDLIITAAYGQIVPKAILARPQYGCINVHGSLLPKYRGGAPIQHAIMNGEDKTGVTIMYMAEGLDTGDMISSVEVGIASDDHSGSMFAKLSEAGAQLLISTLPQIISGEAKAIPQDSEQATYAPNLKREDEQIRWNQPAEQIFNLVRALYPQPCAYTTLADQIVKIHRCALVQRNGNEAAQHDQAQAALPGTVLHASEDGIEVQTGGGVLRIAEIQPAGKKPMSVSQFLRGNPLQSGVRLGG
ncbi:MAG: methionyl-tRNA formyltransferase [Paenibacillus sp. RIFOXYA1_FULL_44_5]|nr:MAG: methionyl-tRNA formyltransferase [Paenibacillus sp. RIFOXYA1_FULL_44_5]